jgi:hypothetical protein
MTDDKSPVAVTTAARQVMSPARSLLSFVAFENYTYDFEQLGSCVSAILSAYTDQQAVLAAEAHDVRLRMEDRDAVMADAVLSHTPPSRDQGEVDSMIERLRSYRPANEWGDGVRHEICDEAASLLEQLTAPQDAGEGTGADIALVGSAIPEGFVLVPREPTEAMLDVLHENIRILVDPVERTTDIQNDREVWTAMLSAAPHTRQGGVSMSFGDELAEAIMLATKLHRGQSDKAGLPYILHPLRVMLACKSDSEKIAAILHDTVEDCGLEFGFVEKRFGKEIADAVDALTRRDETYAEFIERCAENPIARVVKMADLHDNMDMTRLPTITEKDMARLAKYVRADMRLRDGKWPKDSDSQRIVGVV